MMIKTIDAQLREIETNIQHFEPTLKALEKLELQLKQILADAPPAYWADPRSVQEI